MCFHFLFTIHKPDNIGLRVFLSTTNKTCACVNSSYCFKYEIHGYESEKERERKKTRIFERITIDRAYAANDKVNIENDDRKTNSTQWDDSASTNSLVIFCFIQLNYSVLNLQTYSNELSISITAYSIRRNLETFL